MLRSNNLDVYQRYMDAMTMTFSVPDKKILEGVEPGAKVEFDVEVVKGEHRVTAIRAR